MLNSIISISFARISNEYKSLFLINLERIKSILDPCNNLIIFSERIDYDVTNQKIFSESNTKILDEFDNTYKVNGFDYSIKDKIIKLNNTKISDSSSLKIICKRLLLLNSVFNKRRFSEGQSVFNHFFYFIV